MIIGSRRDGGIGARGDVRVHGDGFFPLGCSLGQPGMVEAFGPDKADVIYDCAGNNITMGQAIKYARKGSTIVLVAVFAGMAEVDLAVANDHELDIKSTMMYRHDDYIDGIRLVNEGKVHLKPLISKTFAFKDYLKAYQYIDDNRETTMKVIINVSEK